MVEVVRVLDISGKEVMRVVSPNNNKIDISCLSAGVYTVLANSGAEVYRNLLIVK